MFNPKIRTASLEQLNDKIQLMCGLARVVGWLSLGRLIVIIISYRDCVPIATVVESLLFVDAILVPGGS